MAMSSQPQSSQSGELTSDNLQEVFEALYSITPYYVPFGMKLNVHLNTIKVIEMQYGNPCDRLLHILDYRLNQLPHLTWHDIVQALQSPTVQQHDLARTIESQYITASQSPASVSQQASAESSHAAIHTSGAQPSTHAPPQPPLHTVEAASVPLTHTLPQPSFYNAGQPLQLTHPLFTNQPSMLPNPNAFAPHPAYNLPLYHQHYIQPQLPPQYFVPPYTLSQQLSASSQVSYGPTSVAASGSNLSHAGVEDSSHTSNSSSPQAAHNPPHSPPPSMQPRAQNMLLHDSGSLSPYRHPQYIQQQCPPQHPPINIPYPTPYSSQTSASTSRHVFQEQLGSQPNTQLYTSHPEHQLVHEQSLGQSGSSSSELEPPQAKKARNEPILDHLKSNTVAHSLPNQLSLHQNTLERYPVYNRHQSFYYQQCPQYPQPQPPSQYVPPTVRESSSQQANYFPLQVYETYPSQQNLAGFPSITPTSYITSTDATLAPQVPTASHNAPPAIPTPQHNLTDHTDIHINSPDMHQQPVNIHVGPTSLHMQSQSPSLHSDPPQAKRPHHDTSVAQLSEPLPPQGSVTSQHDALYPPEFTSFVKKVYKRSKVGNPKDTKWPPMASKHFINLVIINRETVSLDEADEYTKSLVLYGDLDAILHEKQPIELNEIAKDIPEDSIILVEGAPGVGKSTFAWEFCRRWERGEIAQQYQLVLLLRLRDEGMSYAKSLEDLIRLYHHSDTLCQTVLRTLEASRGESSLIILEGFDELPNTCRTESSVFMKLISGKVLEKATVLITSRHWATRIIHQTNEDRIFQHIEILGFTEPQIKEYIRSIFIDKRKDPDQIVTQKINETMAYVEKYPQIKACMYIPLNTAIVVNVYQESKADHCILPRTLTELYYALTQTLLLRYLYGHPEYGKEDWVVRDIKRDMPEEVFTKLLNICHEAYKGICTVEEDRVQLIFSNLCPGFETLGFMQSVPQLYTTQGAVVSHNFLHLTVQEFLASLHISFMSPEQQLQHLKRHKEGKLKVVLRFLAGLTKLTNISLDQIKGLFGKPLQENESSQGKCCTCMTPDISVAVHHTNWMFETQSPEIIKTLLENGTVEFVCEKGMVPLEYYCVGYCIAHSQCNWCLTFAEDMEDEKLEMFLTEINKIGGDTEHRVAVKTDQPMPSEKLNTLFAALGPWLEELYLKLSDNGSSLSLTNLPALHILELGMYSKSALHLSSDLSLQSLESLTINAGNSGNTLGLKSCKAICKLLSTSISLKELHFNVAPRKTWSTTGMEAITKSMSDNMALPLRSLQIECKCTFRNTSATALALFIKNSTSLKYVSMCNVTISAQGLQELHEAVHNCSSLQEKKFKKLLCGGGMKDATKYTQFFNDYADNLLELNLYNTNISDAGATALAQALHHNSTLKRLYLSNNNISNVGATALAQALHHNSTLEMLHLSNKNISDVGATDLAQALHHNSTLNELHLSNTNISDAGATALAQALHHNSTLKRLYLSNNNISNVGATALAQALHHNSTLEMLHLSSKNISDVGATDLAQALHHNSTLNELYLSNNNISDVGATDLAQALHHNSTLNELHLSNNNISDVGATDLAQALHHNSTLKDLWLHGNDGIGEEGTRQLVQALTVNTSINRLWLPRRCEEYASQCMEYNAVKTKITFS